MWRSGVAVLAVLTLALPPALAAMSRADRIRETGLSDTLLGQFTPASGDPRLIARYAKVSQKARQAFSFTPALAEGQRSNRAITVVVRSRDPLPAASDAARTKALVASRTVQPVAITPIAYNLGASVGFEKFVTPQISGGVDLRNLPEVREPETTRRAPRFAARMSAAPRDPAAAPARALPPTSAQTVDVMSSYRVTRNLDVTAGVRYNDAQNRLEPLTDSRRDSQAVYVGTQFRF